MSRKLKLLILFSVCFSSVMSQTLNPHLNTAAINLDPNDNFTYLGNTVAHYGLGWYSEYATVPPLGYLSSYAGVRFFTAGQPRLSIEMNGYVGIGTTSPQEKLSVSGNIHLSVGSNEGAALILQNPNKTANDEANRWVLYNMTGNYGNSLQFWSYNQTNTVYAPRFTLADNGNVGIGTTTPTEKLAVNGKMRAKEIKVETTNWPDYVFDQDYRITGLQDLDAYIKLNKHLPEMPSAVDVAKNGVELGEMNKLLLKKIEELTLHLIEKDRDFKKLEQQQSELVKKVEWLMKK